MNKFLITAGAVLSVLLLLFSLFFGCIYFTVYSPERFTDGVSASIDTKAFKEKLNTQTALYSDTYGFDNQLISEIVNSENIHALASSYFTDYYTAFVNGDSTFPSFSYKNDSFYTVINENYESALRPELYATEESRQYLADKYNACVESAIASLSVNTLYNMLIKLREPYLEVASIGKYFIPCVICFAIICIITTVFTVRKKLYKTAYFTTLSYFTATSLFTVPLLYVSSLDLPSKLNVSVGMSEVYIKAVYDFLVTKTSYALLLISIVSLVLFVLTIVWNVRKKDN